MNLFGYEIRRKEDKEEQPKSFAAPLNDDGAVNVESTAVGGAYGYFLDIEGSAKTESELVTRYRSMALQPEVQQAVDEIVNEAINIDYNEQAIEIVLEDTELPDKVKETITEEFENILRLLDFSNQGYEIFQRYFVDGRINYHVIIDEKNLKKGIQELRYLDPRKIRLIRENDSSQVDKNTGVPIRKIKKEYYMYSESGFGSAVSKPGGDMQTHTGYKIAKDSIARVTSGLMNETQSLVLSHLHRAIKPLNQLRILEDATVIYTLTRAPERRIFYVDVGNLPKAKAEQYLADMMARHKNKLSYNSSTGEVGDQRKFMCYDLSTKIPLLDGRTLELRELIEEHNAGKENWVYSCDPKTGKFYPGPVSWAGITKTEADVVKVTFDNGKHVVCTPDHKFPVWGKGFIEAQHLTPDDSIIPGYRRKAKVTENTTTEYEQIYKNETGKWEFTHREVTRWKDEVGLREEFIHNDGNASMKKGVVHHKNFKPYDNNPSNLVMMNHKDHMEYHREINSILYNAEIYDIVEECAIAQYSIEEALSYINEHASIIESWRMENTGRHISGREPDVLSFTYKDLKRISSFMGYKDWRAYRREFETFDREDNGRKVRNPDAVKKGSSEHYQRISNAHKGKVYSSKTWKVASPDGQTFIIENLSDYCRENGLHRSNIKRDYGSKGYKAEILKNHRITSVEKLDDKRTVGSISVDNNETYHSHHTYLLDAGVYTKNTMTEDFWFPRREGCFDLSTKVDLLDGRSVELGQLIVEHKSGKTNWTYSVSPEGKIVPGKISWAGVTRNDAQVLDVHLDNGEVITATPDHKFILRTGEIIQAQNMQTGTSLMPFYTRTKANGRTVVQKDYQQILHNDESQWEYTHQMVSNYFNGKPEKNEVIHHIDNNRFNNNPDNLQIMDKVEHLVLHSTMAKYGWRDEVYEQHCENLSKAGKEFFQTEAGMERRKEISDFNKKSKEVWEGLKKGRDSIKAERAKDREILSKEDYLAKWSPGLNHDMSIKGMEAAKSAIEHDRNTLSPAEWKAKYSNRNSSTRTYERKITSLTLQDLSDIIRELLAKNINAKNVDIVKAVQLNYGEDITHSTINKFVRDSGYETLSHFIYRYCGIEYVSNRRSGQVKKEKRSGNHCVTKIVWRDDVMDVGTLTIDEHHEHHDYHNFALSAGIFVMNSRATEIEQLPGASGSLMDNENLSYFQRKLYKSLGVPVSRLEPENMYSFGRVSEMTRDELRFSKFVRRLRVRFSILFDVVLEKQLVLKGILTPEEWKDIRDLIRYDFMKDNYFEELKQMEILREKISTLRDIEENVGRYFSREWVQKNVLFMNEDDIKEMQKVIDKERKAGVYKDPDEIDDIDDSGDDFEDEPPTPPLPSADDQGEQPPVDDGDGQEAEESLLINNTNKFQKYKQSRRKQK